MGAICKSLVFRVGDEPLLIIASGANRVDEARFGAEKADAAFAREQTGFAIGGVPPYGHVRAIETIVDEDLLAYATVWAAAARRRRSSRSRPASWWRAPAGASSASRRRATPSVLVVPSSSSV